ncbi:hypothetical protein [Bradyrhizobium sp. CCBAU 51765]|uniref:hypothetical protein n=1 Tax=Bradyrhizobium sp. CCBAU 51765 TaxID=1325102 RepID=UPI001886B983|nr:hypothetical protein [Bradyrhizobium sp. CCBAU 51765]
MSLNIGFFLPWRNGYGRQQKAMFVPTRQKHVCAHGYQPRVCADVHFRVGAQLHRIPSLRAQRRNPDCHREKTLDRVAALAMTMWMQLGTNLVPRTQRSASSAVRC